MAIGSVSTPPTIACGGGRHSTHTHTLLTAHTRVDPLWRGPITSGRGACLLGHTRPVSTVVRIDYKSHSTTAVQHHQPSTARRAAPGGGCAQGRVRLISHPCVPASCTPKHPHYVHGQNHQPSATQIAAQGRGLRAREITSQLASHPCVPRLPWRRPPPMSRWPSQPAQLSNTAS